jgi:hypothetical protein
VERCKRYRNLAISNVNVVTYTKNLYFVGSAAFTFEPTVIEDLGPLLS